MISSIQRVVAATLLLALGAFAGAQTWSTSYEAGLASARAGRWSEARQAFQQASAYRPEDYSGATLLPGPVTERRRWRNGAPYSANFMAAYCGYQAALKMGSGDERSRSLRQVSTEFETLLAKKQTSRETFYFLNLIYVEISDAARAQQLDQAFANSTANWRVDTEVVDPTELAAIAAAAPVGGTTAVKAGGDATIVKAGDIGEGTSASANPSGGVTNPVVGRVAPVATKYALVIANTEGRIEGGRVSFGAADANRVREALVTHAGYPEGNVDLVVNATSGQILASAKALAERVQQDNTVTIFFAGVGVNLDGKDFLAGIEAQDASSSANMVAKAELYKLFMSKGARIFAFYEANRPVVAGRYFGMEMPFVGSISQSQATLPGESVYETTRDGKTVGIYGDALASVLADLRSNRVPILEFGWQVFYRIRRGDAGTTGGASRQTPTLPVLNLLASDARF